MKWICWLCLCGLIVNLLAWILPSSIRPYRVHHWLDDWKVAVTEQTSEYGLGESGIVRGRFSTMYSGGNRKLIARIREDWQQDMAQSNTPTPINSAKIQYDEWGPSHLVRADGVEVTAVGATYTFPYSLGALMCGIPLIGWAAFRGWHLHKRRVTGIVD